MTSYPTIDKLIERVRGDSDAELQWFINAMLKLSGDELKAMEEKLALATEGQLRELSDYGDFVRQVYSELDFTPREIKNLESILDAAM